MTFFGLKYGQDLKNRAAQSHQEFPGVPTPGTKCGDRPLFTIVVALIMPVFLILCKFDGKGVKITHS